MSGISYNKALYDCALECATRRRGRTCKQQWDSPACSGCQFYVKNYINAEPNQVKLFMMQAEMQADALVGGNQGRAIALIIMAVIIIGFVGACNIKSCVKYNVPKKTIATGVPIDVQQVLQTVAKQMRDVNGDGLINCIDAAVLFYQHYPNKNDVRIVYNYKGTWSHLFNEVKIDGEWKAVEPQAYYTNQKSIYMQDVWKREYDPSRNRNVTSDYLKYVKK